MGLPLRLFPIEPPFSIADAEDEAFEPKPAVKTAAAIGPKRRKGLGMAD